MKKAKKLAPDELRAEYKRSDFPSLVRGKYINRLRNKIDRGFDVPLIQTVRGHGYVLRAAEPSAL